MARNKVLEADVARMAPRMEKLTLSLAEQEAAITKKMVDLNILVESHASKANLLQARLDAMKDYEQIKNELGIFKSVQFGDQVSEKPLEVLLLEKNKKVESLIHADRLNQN